MKSISTLFVTMALIAGLFAGTIEHAHAEAEVDGTVNTILTLEAADGTRHELTLADLDALPQLTIRTKTPWHEGVQVFSGPSILTVLNRFNVKGTNFLAVSLNGYQALMALADFSTGQPILATRWNGKRMTVRDKGPIFIIYYYGPNDSWESEKTKQSVWQLNNLRVVRQ